MTDSKTATERLRELLDELGVEWSDHSDENITHTTWDGMDCWFNEFPDGWTAWGVAKRGTPEQAIAATLGEHHPYEHRITGDGSNWGEIMADAFDGLMSDAGESCSPDELEALRRHIAATLGGGKLTAEQVHECTERVYLEGYSDGSANRGAHIDETDWQTIADELNAAIGDQDAVAFCKRVEQAVESREPLTLFGVDYFATMGDDVYKQAAEYWKGMYEEILTERIGEERDYPEHDGRYECPECGNVVYYDELHGGGWTIYVEDYQIPFNACPNCGEAVKR